MWNHICRKEHVKTKLNKFQRMAIIAITSAWSSTPTAAIEALLDLPPLHVFIESEAMSTLDRLARQQSTIHRKTEHTNIWQDIIRSEPTLDMPSDRITATFRFDRKFDVSIPPREHWINGILPPEHGIVLYTDGSVINNAAGAGLHCGNPVLERSIPLGMHSSIFLAEMRAIIESCHYIEEQAITNEIIFICSDSQAALKALSSVIFKSALTLECWESLNSIASLNRIDLIWVPGHSNVIGNEKADELARTGALRLPTGPEPILCTPHSHKRRILRTLIQAKCNNYWNNVPGCRQAKNCIRIDKKSSKYLINLSRTRLKIYIGVTTGHFGFNKHLTTIGKRTDPGCELCGEHMDTAEHFLCNCPAFITNRRKHLGGYTIRYSLIRSLQPKDILNYINSTGRFQPTANV
jgi:ribonuclease HI